MQAVAGEQDPRLLQIIIVLHHPRHRLGVEVDAGRRRFVAFGGIMKRMVSSFPAMVAMAACERKDAALAARPTIAAQKGASPRLRASRLVFAGACIIC